MHLSAICLYAEGADDDEPQVLLSQRQCVLENPFDVRSTQLVLAVEQEARQRLLGHHAGPPAGSMIVSGTHAHDSSIKLQQAESMIQHLQRCDLSYSIAYLLATAITQSQCCVKALSLQQHPVHCLFVHAIIIHPSAQSTIHCMNQTMGKLVV